MFTDDYNIFPSAKEIKKVIVSEMNAHLSKVYTQLKANNLSFKTEESVYMMFMPRNAQTKIPFHDEHIAKYILEKLTDAKSI